MQLGIIAHAPTTEGRTEKIRLSLIDYKNARSDGSAAVTLHFQRKRGKEYSFVTMDCNRMTTAEELSEIASILKALGNMRKKHGDKMDDPANLITVAQKQLGRQVVWNGSEWVRAAQLKGDDAMWRALIGGKEFSVRAEKEDTARRRIMQSAGDDAIGDLSKATAMTEWIGDGAPVEKIKAESEELEVHPLSNYFHRDADKAEAKKSS